MLFKKNRVFWWGVVSYCILAAIMIYSEVSDFMLGAWRADEESPMGGEIVYPPLLEAKGEMLQMTIETLVKESIWMLFVLLIIVVILFTVIKLLVFLWGKLNKYQKIY